MELLLPKQEGISWLQACSQLARDRERYGVDSNLSPEAESKLPSQGLFEWRRGAVTTVTSVLEDPKDKEKMGSRVSE